MELVVSVAIRMDVMDPAQLATWVVLATAVKRVEDPTQILLSVSVSIHSPISVQNSMQ